MSNEVNIGDMIYLTIPKEWIKTYHSLLYMLASVGKQIIDDCSYTCQGSGRNIFSCWNLFQSALAAKALGDSRKAQFFINYIDNQLALYARVSKIVIPDFSENYPTVINKINSDGTYTFYITCKVEGIVYTKEVTIPEVEPHIVSTEYERPIITSFSYANNVSNEGGSARVESLTFIQRVKYYLNNGTYTSDDIVGNLNTEGLIVTYNISNAINNARVDAFGNVEANPSTVSNSRTICKITPQITINGETSSSNNAIAVDIMQDGAICTFVGGSTTFGITNVGSSGINTSVNINKTSGVSIISVNSDSSDVIASYDSENNIIELEVFNNDSARPRQLIVTVTTSINVLTINIIQDGIEEESDVAYYGTSNVLPTTLGNNSISLNSGDNEIIISEYGKYQWVAVPNNINAIVTICDSDRDEVEQQDNDSQIDGYILYYWQTFVQSDGAVITINVI